MTVVIKAEKRNEVGKNAAGRLRRQGFVPAILYGQSVGNVSLTLKKKEIIDILKSGTGENTIFGVAFDSEKREVMIKEVQINPISDELTHVDLIQISMDKPVRVSVPVELLGEAVGIKSEGGIIDFLMRELDIECLPRDIPEAIKVDISNLHLHQSIKVQNLDLPAGVKVFNDPHAAVVVISSPEKEAAPPAEEVIEPAEMKEPEIIKKERKKEEEAEEEKETKG